VRGRVVSLFMTVLGGAFPVGSLLGGAIADRIGAPATTIAGAVVVLAWGLGLIFWSRRRAMAVDARAIAHAPGDGEKGPRDVAEGQAMARRRDEAPA
jgi:predicted MFS family arabinose efflux permease